MDDSALDLFCALYRSLYEHYVYANWTHERSGRAYSVLQETAQILRAHGRLPEDAFHLLATKEEYAVTPTKTH